MNRNKVNTSDKKWRLILVGSRGSVIPLGAIKTLLIGLIGTLVVTISCAIVLGLFYMRQKMELTAVTDELDRKDEQLQTLRDKRDMLMARLVITESKLDSGGESEGGGEPEKSSDSPELDADADSAQPAQEKEKADLKTAAADTAPAAPRVAVSDFKIFHDSRAKEIHASYILKNTSPEHGRIGGKCVLLLKGTINGEITSYPIPNVPWENGMPSARLGRPFYIRNFMAVKLSRSSPEQSVIFDRVIIYVFETKGAVLLKKEVPIDLSYAEEIPPPKTQTSIKNSKDSEEEADIKENSSVDNEPQNPTAEPATSEALP